jgi:response regulator NasT
VEVALARFKSDQALRAELNQARTALSERKLIDRAKGMLMQARGMTEEEAYQTMRKLAMDQGKRMADIASNVIAIADVLGKAS